MLNYLIAMSRWMIFLGLIFITLLVRPGSGVFARQENPTPTTASVISQPEDAITILSPAPGEAIQGVVQILVSAGVSDIQSLEVAFAYAADTTETWFLIDERSQTEGAETAIEWDTSFITDGDYKLRLLVIQSNGSTLRAETTGVRVRNYTPVETSTPAPAATSPTRATATTASVEPKPSAAPTSMPAKSKPTTTPPPTASATPTPATPLRNPAALTSEEVLLGTARGALAVMGAFALGGVYWSLRRLGKR